MMNSIFLAPATLVIWTTPLKLSIRLSLAIIIVELADKIISKMELFGNIPERQIFD
jgi:hypothetical protein